MRTKILVVAAVAVFVVIALGAGTGAQSPSPTTEPSPGSDFLGSISPTIFPWAAKPGGATGNWLEGLVFGLVGVVGALVTVYLFLGDFLPSMGGKAEYEALRLEIADLEKRRDKLLTLRERFARGL